MPYDSFKHHRRSIRLRGYDYSQAGAYFVTICVQNRECLFGEITAGGEMQLNDAGKMIVRWWDELSNKFPTFEPDAFVVMPNHIHCIVVITDVGTINKGRPHAVIRRGFFLNVSVGSVQDEREITKANPARVHSAGAHHRAHG